VGGAKVASKDEKETDKEELKSEGEEEESKEGPSRSQVIIE
jgi:hypothetical protein